ncbi:MAG TPA: hypothetical protein P5132_01685 [Bacteroidales bacterium]|nr:hypothetical protein [Bacteroidales bacterium]
MEKKHRQKSIFRQLFLKVTIIVLLLNVILAIITIQDAINIKLNSENELRNKLRNEISGLSHFQISALKTFEKSFYDLQKTALETFTKNRKIDFRNANLNEQLNLLGLDSIFHDLYIIENNHVVNTTYTPDWGLDFSAFGQERLDQLNKIILSGDFYAERFQFESSTKRLKSYSYQPTPDSKFLIEIGSYSEVADKIIEMFIQRLKQITEENNDIISVNYWFGNDEYQFPLIDEPLNRYIPGEIIDSAFIKQHDQEIKFNIKDQKLSAEVMYFKQEESTRLPDFALSIITDLTNKNNPIIKIIIRQTLFAIIILVLIIGSIFIAIRRLEKNQ